MVRACCVFIVLVCLQGLTPEAQPGICITPADDAGCAEDTVSAALLQSVQMGRADTLVGDESNPSGRAPHMLTEVEEMVKQDLKDLPAELKSKLLDAAARMKAEITETLEPGLLQVKSIVEQRVLELTRACGITPDLLGADEKQTKADELRNTHVACRGEEQNLLKAKDDACSAYTTFKERISHDAKPPVSADRATWHSWFESMELSLEGKKELHKEKADACDSAATSHAHKKEQCSRDQGKFEGKFCTWRESLLDACHNYGAAHQRATTDYDTARPNIENQIESLKNDWTATKRIVCYIDAWADEEASPTLAECGTTSIDVSPVDVEIDACPAATTCDVSPVKDYPGTNSFKLNEYTNCCSSSTSPHGEIDACDPWMAPGSEEEAATCFEYVGAYDGVCTYSGGRASPKKGTGLPEPGEPTNETFLEWQRWCSDTPTCLGFGTHYLVDRVYYATDNYVTLTCPHKASENRCGDGSPTNGCYVKFVCGADVPYQYVPQEQAKSDFDEDEAQGKTVVPQSASYTFEGVNVAAASSGAVAFASGSYRGECSDTSAGTATDASQVAATGQHCFKNINDGKFGDSHSWIGGSDPAFVGIAFPSSKVISGFAIGRDQRFSLHDRISGTKTFEVTGDVNPYDSKTSWTQVGQSFRMSTAKRNVYKFNDPIIGVTGIRLKTTDRNDCIDELEVYAATK